MESEPINPAGRIDGNGDVRNVDNAYEEGIYHAVIGLSVTDNPYHSTDTLNHKLWLKGFCAVKNKKIKPNGEKDKS
ncbi:hypothetical protein [Atlantibacter hermannii]|uniref:hypothetical protein n=1 Tax=Atlantibacter hermannii TaxID=565 RepID=UPI00324D5EDA